MTKTEKLLLVELICCSGLSTSSNTREWVRLSAAGLVNRGKGFLHTQTVSLTEAGLVKAEEIATAMLDEFRKSYEDHRERYGTPSAKFGKICHCGQCAAVRRADRRLQEKSVPV